MSIFLTGVVRCDVASLPRNSSLPLHSDLAGLAPVVACRRHGPPTASEKWRMSRGRHAYTLRPHSVAADTSQASLSESAIRTETWTWRGHRIRYLVAGRRGDSSSPALLLVHGFGSNADHWRKIMEVQAGDREVYAIDLLGYGYSDKPDPRLAGPPSSLYNFDTWSDQLLDFTRAVIGRSAVLSCNSVGGLAGLQAAVKDPAIVRAVQVINISLRALHLSKQAAWKRPAVSTLQRALRTTGAGPWLFKRLATRDGVRKVLQTCYGDPKTVTDELVDYILKPGLEPGAVEVFLDFISYSSGPLPEDLLQACKVPVSILWGEADPWEPVKLGRTLALYPSVEEWASLPGVGHCPQDEAPDQVNPFVTEFMRRHGGECATSQSSQRNLHASLDNSPLDSAAAKSA
ncbi:CPLD60 [Auxenochlorella protothecoides x Auxenochlorella symbiontica]